MDVCQFYLYRKLFGWNFQKFKIFIFTWKKPSKIQRRFFNFATASMSLRYQIYKRDRVVAHDWKIISEHQRQFFFITEKGELFLFFSFVRFTTFQVILQVVLSLEHSFTFQFPRKTIKNRSHIIVRKKIFKLMSLNCSLVAINLIYESELCVVIYRYRHFGGNLRPAFWR